MGAHATLSFIPRNETIQTKENDAGELTDRTIAPEYDGTTFWISPGTEREEQWEICAIALPLPNGQLYYHERDWNPLENEAWERRIAETVKAYAPAYKPVCLYTKT